MIFRLRSAISRDHGRNALLICLLFLALGGLAGCGADDSSLGTGKADTGTSQTDTSQPDTASPEDTTSADTQQPEDTASDEDTNVGVDTSEMSDAQDGGDANADAEVDAGPDADSGTPDNACNDSSDCDSSGGICVEPGGFVGCGMCQDYLVTCTADTDCEQTSQGENGIRYVCEKVTPEDCACDTSISICKLACEQHSDCAQGERCNPEGHCIATPCTPASSEVQARSCPPNFSCQAALCPVDSTDCFECARTQCASDAECPSDGSVCVNGQCHDEPGSCQFPPP